MNLLAHRSFSKILGALTQRRHYTALWNMWRQAPDFGDLLVRYLSGKGAYPYICRVKTPNGLIEPTLYSYYDLLTLNEIFFREDYRSGTREKIIVDIGSNIGLSALYFLTRNADAFCYLFEPDPRNAERLRKNLAGLEKRFHLQEAAVSNEAGTLRFGLDVISGRYGGLDVDFGSTIMVTCLHINAVLKEILDKHGAVDILKIDTEGSEVRTVEAISQDIAGRIGKIYIEAHPGKRLLPEFFSQEQFGTVYRLVNFSGQPRTSYRPN